MSKILITSALPYVNGVPHLGHLVGCLLPSDVYARYMRMMGHEVLYVCGTDEHGTPSEVGAAKEGMDVADYCLKYHNRHKEAYDAFNLSFDYFGRTSSEQNREITYHIFEQLDKNGLIEEESIKQIFSIDDNRFLPDRYVTGTCPHCGYDKARGDQCENCTKVLDPTELINPRSTISGSTNLEVRETKHLFLNLPKLEKQLAEWVKSKEPFWPDVAYSIAQKWLKEGLRPRCITRDLKWGFPVPKKGFEDKVFYVWFDAPIGYLGITKQWADEKPGERNWKDWWLDAKDVYYVQFMGKDNVPFHSISFPATLLGTGENWTKVDYLKGMSYLTFEGGKFSKSEQRGVFAEDAVKEFPADYWRYWLISNAPEASDSSFTFDLFAGVVNKDLNGVLGNFVSRVMKMTASKIGAEVPAGGEMTEVEEKLIADLQEKADNYCKYMEGLEFKKAMNELRAIKARVQPHEILLVVDAMVGQDSVNVASSFDEALGIDGVILTKLDGDTRGGAALSVRAVTGKPIKFVGTGEKLDNLEPFYPDRMASRILGMGDVLTLIEKAQSTEQNFDMNDLLEQMQQI